ncbi:cytochrome c oxidase assembly protein [Actinospica sp. MGRD01-02]|uniref:Cytochrome c oxidase assembly protein n=1 Tax=Actinospica acidithermotolerans TaxID=2828514 RepID=A0A941IPT7_9ACTN|nr:cytochrome c oxidase assembly protein [Actinospica acidithermotolerans]MBR7830756.1 cytochrome c oxidase assembly protein [Actinospica acidithermotolerans]
MVLAEASARCLSRGCGPASALHWGEVLTAWKFDPAMLAALLLGVAGYALGVRRYQREVGRWPVSRSICFTVSVILFTLSTMSFIGDYEKVLFWDRALQNGLLLMTTPLFLACSAPLTLVTSGEGRGARLARRIIASRPMRLLTFPATVSLLLLVTPYALYFTGWYLSSLTNSFVDETSHLELLAVGFLYFWSRIQIDPAPKQYTHMISVWISFIEGVGDAGVSIVLWLGGGLVAGGYYASFSTLPHAVLYAPLRLGATSGLAWNQAVGGAVFWIVGDLTSIPLLAALWRGLHREETAAASSVQEDLEVAEIEYAPGDGSAQERYRPWWQNDPRFTNRSTGPV